MDGHNSSAHNKRPNRGRQILEGIMQRLYEALSPVVRTNPPASPVPELPEDDDVLRHHGKKTYPDSLFADLLMELPMHRRRLSHAHKNGSTEALRLATHHLLGAVVYCDAPELEEALRELRLAIQTGEQHTIDVYHDRAINVLDSTLRYSGYRG